MGKNKLAKTSRFPDPLIKNVQSMPAVLTAKWSAYGRLEKVVVDNGSYFVGTPATKILTGLKAP